MSFSRWELACFSSLNVRSNCRAWGPFSHTHTKIRARVSAVYDCKSFQASHFRKGRGCARNDLGSEIWKSRCTLVSAPFFSVLRKLPISSKRASSWSLFVLFSVILHPHHILTQEVIPATQQKKIVASCFPWSDDSVASIFL